MNGFDVKSMNFTELSAVLSDMGLPSYRAKQIYSWIHQKCAVSYDEMTNLPLSLRSELSAKLPLQVCGIEKKQVSASDGTVKYLFSFGDGEYAESVLMKYKYGYTICVSTQIGCKMGCTFCASTLGGYVRNLLPSEILSQVYSAQRDENIRISHIVLMGMGEPLDNFDNVMRFLELVTSEDGLNISMRNISLSTCGIVPGIYNLLERKLQLTLSISLHAPDDELRSRVMPINRRYGLESLIKACREYANVTSRRISFEYAMLGGVNDTDECAYKLAALLKGMLCHVNLIPVNEVSESPYKPSSPERIKRFIDILEEKSINVTVRRKLGSDIDASCGQLRLRKIKEPETL